MSARSGRKVVSQMARKLIYVYSKQAIVKVSSGGFERLNDLTTKSSTPFGSMDPLMSGVYRTTDDVSPTVVAGNVAVVTSKGDPEDPPPPPPPPPNPYKPSDSPELLDWAIP